MLTVKARVGELPPKGVFSRTRLEKEGCSVGGTKKESLGVSRKHPEAQRGRNIDGKRGNREGCHSQSKRRVRGFTQGPKCQAQGPRLVPGGGRNL